MKTTINHTFCKRLTLALAALFFCMPLAFAQESEITMSGTVVDEHNEPMTGVAVYAIHVSTMHGTATDLDGFYQLDVPEGSQITFSFIGYKDQIVDAVAGTLNIQMEPNTSVLDESVVVGYGVQKRSSLTGAISSVTSEDMENRTTTNLMATMSGKTAGVQAVQTSAAPGSSPTIRVRGYSSNVASSPLYVVDGVRLSDVSGIDPNDIESMEILKDAASAAIYGAEAGNGVVLITTKRGKSGEGKITYDFQLTTQSLYKMPKMLNSEEYIQYLVEGGVASEEYFMKNWDGVTNTSWGDVAFETSLMQRHNIAFSNGSDKGNYYVSLSYLNNDGIVRGDQDTYKRLTGVINGEWHIKSWLTVGTTNQIERYKTKSVSENTEYGSLFAGVLYMDPLTKDTYTYDELPSHMLNALNNGYTLLQNSKGEYYGVSAFTASENYHPMIMRDNSETGYSGFNVNGSAYLNFNPFKFLTYTSRFGYRLSGYSYSSTSLPYYGNSTQSNNYVAQSNTSSTTIYYQWENFLNYNQTFGKHTIGAMIGMSFQKQIYDYVSGSASANGEDALTKNDPLFYYLNYASASSTKGIGGETTETAKLSYFGRINYEYGGRYMIQASLRADAADLSMLPKSGRWGFFPAVSAGWVISEEKFFAGIKDKVNQLKLRFSWGQNGSLAALGSYAYSTDMTTGSIYPFVAGNVYTNAVYPTSLGNDNLTWETSEQYDVGIDALFFNDRFSVSMDWYDKATKNLLVSGTTPSLIIGGTTSPINAGNVSNRGYELNLGWKDTAGDFFYSINANMSTLRNRVTYLDPSLTRLGGTTFGRETYTYFETGYPIYYFRGYEFTGVDPDTGDPTFADLDGDGEISDGDLTYIGDGIPRVSFGVTLTFAWKGIDLTIFGSGAAGNKIWNCISRTDYPYINRMKEVFYNDRWTETNHSGSVPRANCNNADKYQRSSAMIYSGNFFKIKQIQLGYSFPKKWMSKIRVSNLRLYVSLDDFITFTSYPGFDPEGAASATSGMGIDKAAYPNSKKFVCGLNLEF
ncbi:MAG: TonB-dependent receptor [Bacteroidales bacterium]|nr:TonB-dependent receptor [Bacteroidales bacterium]